MNMFHARCIRFNRNGIIKRFFSRSIICTRKLSRWHIATHSKWYNGPGSMGMLLSISAVCFWQLHEYNAIKVQTINFIFVSLSVSAVLFTEFRHNFMFSRKAKKKKTNGKELSSGTRDNHVKMSAFNWFINARAISDRLCSLETYWFGCFQMYDSTID